MNLRGLIPNEFTTAQLNGHPVSVRPAHSHWTAADYVLGAPESADYEPVAVTVVTPVALSPEDVAATLFGWAVSVEELADDSYVRLLVAETVINQGSGQIEELRCQLGERTLTELAAYLTYCRDRAAHACVQAAPQRAACGPGAGVTTDELHGEVAR
ncbi:MAG: hypothetical protein ACRDSF_04960 [Pseudonocardiaceae bacterium]